MRYMAIEPIRFSFFVLIRLKIFFQNFVSIEKYAHFASFLILQVFGLFINKQYTTKNLPVFLFSLSPEEKFFTLQSFTFIRLHIQQSLHFKKKINIIFWTLKFKSREKLLVIWQVLILIFIPFLFLTKLSSTIFIVPIVKVVKFCILAKTYVTQKVYFYLEIHMLLKFLTFLEIIHLLKRRFHHLWAPL